MMHATSRTVRSRALAVIVALAAIHASAPAASGGGYARLEHGAAALGAAGAFTATANDPSAIFYNPAGVARLQGTQLMGGVSPVAPRIDFAGTAPFPGYDVSERWNDEVLLPPHAYVTVPLVRGIVAGVGAYVPFAIESDWRGSETFSGRFIASLTRIRGTYVTPTLAAELTPKLSIGVGASIVFADADLERRLPASVFEDGGQQTTDVAELTFDGDLTTGVTFGAGLLYDAGRIHLGASYRHGITNEIEGDATFRFLPTGDAGRDSVLATRVPRDQRGAAEVPFPPSATLGVAYDLSDGARIEVDVSWTGWSSVDALPLAFTRDTSLDTRLVEGYDDALGARVGISTRASDKLTFRGGYAFDDTPSPSSAVGPAVPDARRHGLSAGVGYAHERWRLDLFQMLVLFEDRSVRDNVDDFNGDYARSTWVSGVSIIYAIW